MRRGFYYRLLQIKEKREVAVYGENDIDDGWKRLDCT